MCFGRNSGKKGDFAHYMEGDIMDYNNDNYNNNNYNDDNYNNNNSAYDGDKDAETYESGNSGNPYDNSYYSQSSSYPYEQSGTNTGQNFNRTTGGQSAYISSEYSSPYASSEYSSSYGQNNYQTSYNTTDTAEKEEPVSVLDWVGTLLLAWIPCAALIVYLIWAFGSGAKKSKSNYCKAYLLVSLISTGLFLVFYVLMFVIMFAASEL